MYASNFILMSPTLCTKNVSNYVFTDFNSCSSCIKTPSALTWSTALLCIGLYPEASILDDRCVHMIRELP